jgi:hypothetical protein
VILRKGRRPYGNEGFRVKLDQEVYDLDSTARDGSYYYISWIAAISTSLVCMLFIRSRVSLRYELNARKKYPME